MVDELCVNARVHEASDPWVGHSTLVHVGRDRLRAMIPRLAAVCGAEVDAQVTVVTEDRVSERRLVAAGFQEVRRTRRGAPCYATDAEGARAWRAAVMLIGGRRRDGGTAT